MAVKKSGFSREFIIHPGESLGEALRDRGMEQKELALRVGLTEAYISKVINGQRPLSVSLAKKLEYALGIDAGFWINLQANYEMELADYKDLNEISDEELSVLKRLGGIVKYLKQLGFLAHDLNGPMLAVEFRKLLKVSNLMQIPALSQAGAYRLGTSTDVDPYVLFTWLRVCDLLAEGQQVEQELDVDQLKQKIPHIKKLMFEDFAAFQPQLKAYFAQCGIKFSVVKHFTGAPVQGVIKDNSDGTMSLAMAIRQKFADIFWFTLFHEIGHIIHGDIGGRLIDYESAEGEKEDRANEFAENTLIDAAAYNRFVGKGNFSLPAIKQFCAEQKVPPFILIGRLQRGNHLTFSHYSKKKVRYKLTDIVH